MHVFTMKESLLIGTKGEQILESYFKNLGYQVENVTKDSEWQEKDVDFLIRCNQQSEIKIEVKTDNTSYQNFFYEILSNVEHNTPGCMVKTQSDFIIYFFLKRQIFYVINTKCMQNYVRNMEDKLKMSRLRTLKNRLPNGAMFTTVGVSLPIKWLIHLPWVVAQPISQVEIVEKEKQQSLL